MASPHPPARTEPDSGQRGALLGAGLLVLSLLAAFAGAAPVVLWAFPVAAVVTAVVLLLQRRFASYLGLLLVVWLSQAGLRRVVDWQTTYHATSAILIAGALVSLAGLPWVLAARRPVHRDVRAALVVAAVVTVYGAGVGVLKNGVVPALADFLLLAPPLVTGLFAASVLADRDVLRRLLQATARWGCLLLGGYATVQFLVLPPWDAEWIVDSGITSVGRPQPGEFRAFSTLTTTGPLGYVLAVLVLLLVAERRRGWQTLAASVGLLALGLTLLRGGWLTLVLGTVLLLCLGRRSALRLTGVLVVLLAVVLSVPGPARDAITERATRTTSSGSADTSLRTRLEFQAQVAPETLSNPVGDGLGATGVATDLAAEQVENIRIRNFDSGLFENLFRYGALAGAALLGALAWAAALCVWRARRLDLFSAACAVSVLSLVLGLLLVDVLKGVYGLVLYLLLGYLARVPLPDEAQDAPAEPGAAGSLRERGASIAG